MNRVVLPWPPRDLHPNSRPHWAQLAKAKKAYRYACHILTREAGIEIQSGSRPLVAIEFVPPNRRPRDMDGCLSAIKSGLDGVADAIGCDDSRWRLHISMAPDGVIGGMVRVQVFEDGKLSL